MKNTLFSILCCLLFSSVVAQITVNSWNFLGPNEIIIMGIDEGTSITHSPSGPNQTWNYGELNDTSTDTIAYVPAQWIDEHTYFPSANFGAEDGVFSVFFSFTEEAFENVGIYGDLLDDNNPIPVLINPAERVFAFPMEYGQMWQDTSKFTIKSDDVAFGDSLKVTITTYRTAEIDAWGSLTTPFGTFPALRQYSRDSVIQKVEVFAFGATLFEEETDSLSYRYSFVSNQNNAKYLLLEYGYDPEFDLLNSVVWQKTSPILSVEYQEERKLLQIVPNPNQGVFTIQNLKVGDEISIISSTGQQVYKGRCKDASEKFETQNLPSGKYLLIVRNAKGIKALNLVVE